MVSPKRRFSSRPASWKLQRQRRSAVVWSVVLHLCRRLCVETSELANALSSRGAISWNRDRPDQTDVCWRCGGSYYSGASGRSQEVRQTVHSASCIGNRDFAGDDGWGP